MDNGKFTARNYMTYTVALYGNYEPFFFKGHLILRTYYTDGKRHEPDTEKTTAYFIDTLFYETNKVIRAHLGERYDEQRHLVIFPSNLLGEPYYIVYNETAAQGKDSDNSISLLKDSGRGIHGLALVVKKTGEGEYTSLEESEARSIEKTITAILSK